MTQAVARRRSVKKLLLNISQNWQLNNCARVLFFVKLQAKTCNFIKKETLTQVFFCEFYEIFRNNFFHKAPLAAASVMSSLITL